MGTENNPLNVTNINEGATEKDSDASETLLENQKQEEQPKPAPGPDATPSQEQVKNDEAKKPNVILGHNGTALTEGETNFGNVTVVVPDEETQRTKGFFVEPKDVNAFIAQYSGYQYKELKPKGQ